MVIFLRFQSSRGRAGRESRAPHSSCVTRACLRSPENRIKITPVRKLRDAGVYVTNINTDRQAWATCGFTSSSIEKRRGTCHLGFLKGLSNIPKRPNEKICSQETVSTSYCRCVKGVLYFYNASEPGFLAA